jgi:predicted DNA-binding transcriptional regulator AlpA
MKKYSITEAAELVGVNRATVYRWIQKKLVPAPLVEIVAGVEITYWAEAELAKAKEYKRAKYWGQGRKKSKAKGTKKSES